MMMGKQSDAFSNKTFIITGGASGIGLATARLLQNHGANVVLWDQNETQLTMLQTEMECHTVTVDVADVESVRAAIASTINVYGDIHGMIHSAGILRSGTFEDLDIETHRRTIEVNLIGTVVVSHAILPYLQKSQGSLVFLGSVSGVYGPPEYAAYGASKAGVLNFAQAMRIEQRRHKVHIGIVSPHSVDSPMLDEHNRQATFVRKFGLVHTPEQVASSIIKGIQRRRFMIFPNYKPRAVFWLSRYCHFASHQIMSYFWR